MRLGEGLRKLRSAGIGLGPPIAVDFGVHSLKVVQIVPGEPGQLVAASSVPTPGELLGDAEGRLEYQAEALGRVVRSGGFRGRRAVCAIPAVQTLCRVLKVQRGESGDVRALLGAALGAQLGCDPSALVVRHFELGSGRSEVMCVAAARERVERLMRALKGARLEPVGMHPEFVALVRGVGVGGAEGAVLVLDVGYGSSKAAIVHGERLVFAKTIEVGGRELGLTGVSAPGGRVAQMSEGGGCATEVALGTEEGLEQLTDEVRLCVRYHDTLFPSCEVGKVVLAGGVSGAEGLRSRLGAALGVPVEGTDPLGALERLGRERFVGVGGTGCDAAWAVPVGLCRCPTDL